jgi:EAL domain-containing protein (putative c-di-GMP-specific phosphodiesterase class I)
MASVRLHPAESDRLDSLRSYQVLDTQPEPSFDRLVALAARVCDTPLAAVTLVDADRQWFKAAVGLGTLTETPRAWSFCSDVVAGGTAVVIPDVRKRSRYRKNPMATGKPGVRAYAGVPLIGRDGLPLGTLCVIDTKPRTFDAQTLEGLSILADQVVVLLEARRMDRAAGLLDASVLAEARESARLRQALDKGELVPHYQPIVDIVTGRLYGLEALLRWEHPTLGTLSPAAFLPLIENSALVIPVGRALLDIAIAEIAALQGKGHLLPGGVSVNVASEQLARPGLAADVFATLDRHAVSPRQLALEITETTALPDEALARRELTSLAEAGVRIVLDDFGVGWSNFSRLLNLPVSAVKIDRSVAAAVNSDPRAVVIVSSIVSTSFHLDVDVVAEGVETEATCRRLAGLGCRWAQGWLFSPAVPAASLPRLLAKDTTPSCNATGSVNAG